MILFVSIVDWLRYFYPFLLKISDHLKHLLNRDTFYSIFGLKLDVVLVYLE